MEPLKWILPRVKSSILKTLNVTWFVHGRNIMLWNAIPWNRTSKTSKWHSNSMMREWTEHIMIHIFKNLIMNSGVLILDTTTKMEMMMDFFNFGMMCKYISRVSNTICFQYFRFLKKKILLVNSWLLNTKFPYSFLKTLCMIISHYI